MPLKPYYGCSSGNQPRDLGQGLPTGTVAARQPYTLCVALEYLEHTWHRSKCLLQKLRIEEF